MPISLGVRRSSGTTSVSQTWANGSARERQYRRGLCEGSLTELSMRRALRSLMPERAAASSWDLLLRVFM